jgi:methionine-rich copper-binding protein CopC
MKRMLVAAAMAAATVIYAPPAYAHHHDEDSDGDDGSKQSQVCTGFDLGMSPDQIQQGLQRNDGRETPYQAWKDSTWAIINGACG